MPWAFQTADQQPMTEVRAPIPTTTHHKTAWVWGGALTVALCLLFMIGTPSAPFWLVSSALLLTWWLWAFKHLLPAFACLVFVWVTVYARASIPMLQVEGGSHRGGLLLGDLMWLLFMLAWTTVQLRSRRGRLSTALTSTTIISIPLVAYVLLSILLPLAGILLYSYPFSYITPSIRLLQLVAFSVLTYQMIKTYGWTTVMQYLLWTLAISGLANAVQALLQILVTMNIAPKEYVVLDRIYAERFQRNVFYYPRTTGLWVSPMQYGPFGMFLLLTVEALRLAGVPVNKGLKILLYFSSLFALLTSASRAGVGGAALGLLAIYCVMFVRAITSCNTAVLFNLALHLLKVALTIGLAVLISILVLPKMLVDRITLMGIVLLHGAQQDPNASVRLDLWHKALDTYEQEYIWGTLIPPSFVARDYVGDYIHNFYIDSIVQGTPLYLFVFLFFLVLTLWRGWQMCTGSSSAPMVASGLAVIGAAVGLAFVQLTDNKIHMAQFWIPVGFALMRQGRWDESYTSRQGFPTAAQKHSLRSKLYDSAAVDGR